MASEHETAGLGASQSIAHEGCFPDPVADDVALCTAARNPTVRHVRVEINSRHTRQRNPELRRIRMTTEVALATPEKPSGQQAHRTSPSSESNATSAPRRLERPGAKSRTHGHRRA